MKALLIECVICGVGLVLTADSVLAHALGVGVLGVIFTSVGFGMLLRRFFDDSEREGDGAPRDSER